MRLKISKTMKICLIVLNILLMIILGVYLYLFCTIPHFIDKIETKYDYTCKGNATYEVFLKPNILYDSQSLGEGNIYITQFVDYIKTTFDYSYEDGNSADIQGDYEVVAVVEGYTGEGDTLRTIWQKTFVIIPKAPIRNQDKDINITKNSSFKLSEYQEFATILSESSKVNSSAKLKVQMNVNIKANTESGLVEESMSPSIEIPLNTSYFMVTKIDTIEKPGKIEEIVQTEIPIDTSTIIIYSIGLLVLAAAFIYLTFFTLKLSDKDIYTKKFNKIFRSHSTRLVALDSKISIENQNYCEVLSIDDLVRVSDELLKPILYEYSANLFEITQFYVFDGDWVYVFDIRKSVPKTNIGKLQENDGNSTDELIYISTEDDIPSL